MKYHHRYRADNTCEIICTACFFTIGVADGLDAIKEIESQHICLPRTSLQEVGEDSSKPSRAFAYFRPLMRCFPKIEGLVQKHPTLFGAAILFTLILCLYVIPKTIELVLMPRIGTWLAIILFGDILGCAFLAILWRMCKAGIILYLLLTTCESCLYITRALSHHSLIWIVDLVPTILVARGFLKKDAMDPSWNQAT